METTDYPYSLIVNLDGDDSGNAEYLFSLLKEKKISYLILNAGDNRGVGRSFQNCLGVAEGDYIFKIDTDLTFSPGWLSRAVEILENNSDVGTVSLFDYNHYDALDDRFAPSTNHLTIREDCIIVKDFVSSIYGFRKNDLADLAEYKTLPDDGVHHWFIGKMAITKQDYVKNDGFGMNSVYVTIPDRDPTKAFKTPTHEQPLIFKRGSV